MPKKILIVEDDRQIARVYGVKFSTEGFEADFAGDGEEALEKMTASPPDIILLDLMLPKKDGFAVLEEMKKNKAFADIPVLALSNLGQDEDQARAKKLGAVDYIIKADVTIAEVIERVKSYL